MAKCKNCGKEIKEGKCDCIIEITEPAPKIEKKHS